MNDAVQVRAGGETLMLKSAEDTVLRKLLWYEAGGRVSELQWRDVAGVLRVSRGQLDRAYLDRWAKQLRLSELLDRAEQESRQ